MVSISARNRSGPELDAKSRFENLHRHLAVVLEIFGEIHRGHPALAELALDAVAVGEASP